MKYLHVGETVSISYEGKVRIPEQTKHETLCMFCDQAQIARYQPMTHKKTFGVYGASFYKFLSIWPKENFDSKIKYPFHLHTMK